MITRTAAIPPPRCNRHESAADLPKLCHTCQRIDVEHQIVTKVVDTFLAAGYLLSERDDEDNGIAGPPEVLRRWCLSSRDIQPVTREALLAQLFNLDDAFLDVYAADRAERPFGVVRFVFGNDGFDVISDYSTNLETLLTPAHDLARTFDY